MLYASWVGNTYNVTLVYEREEVQIEVTFGEKYELPTMYSTGSIFEGWYTKKTGGIKVTKDTKVSLIKNQTLYAQWTKVSVSKGTVLKLTNTSGKKAVVTIKKISGAKGYQIEYSTSKSFNNSTKKSTTITSLTLSSMIKGKTYYVRVRGYKLDSKGTKIYGTYSAPKLVKIIK